MIGIGTQPTRRAQSRLANIANERARELVRLGKAEVIGKHGDRVVIRMVPTPIHAARKRRRGQRAARKAERRGRK